MKSKETYKEEEARALSPYAFPPRVPSTVGLGAWSHLRRLRDHKPVTCCRSQARDAAYLCAGTQRSAQEWPSQDKPVRRVPLRKTDRQSVRECAFSLNSLRISVRLLHRFSSATLECFRNHVTSRGAFRLINRFFLFPSPSTRHKRAVWDIVSWNRKKRTAGKLTVTACLLHAVSFHLIRWNETWEEADHWGFDQLEVFLNNFLIWFDFRNHIKIQPNDLHRWKMNLPTYVILQDRDSTWTMLPDEIICPFSQKICKNC